MYDSTNKIRIENKIASQNSQDKISMSKVYFVLFVAEFLGTFLLVVS